LLDFLLAPAILAGVVAFVLARLHEHRQQLIQQLRAATAIQVELIANVAALRRFNASFDATVEKVLRPEGYEPFIPVDEHSAMIFDLVKDHLFQMDRATIRSVSRYYKADRQINKLLTDICGQDFAAASGERRREVMAHTRALLQEGLQAGELAISDVRRFVRRRRQSPTLIGYDRAVLRLIRRSVPRPRRLVNARRCRRLE
jgi:hypothetical protein